MRQRFILEVSEQPTRFALYDFHSHALLHAFAGEDWQKMFDEAQTQDTGWHPDGVLALGQDTGADADTVPDLTLGRPAPMAAIEIQRRPQPTLAAVKTGRLKLWDVAHKYHCPIIGTCLGVEELRRIGERHSWLTHSRPSDYEIHVCFVSAADQRNALSLATQKLLEKKYATTINRYAKARTTEALTALWSESLASGNVPGALWALMTHPKADQSALVRAYEDVHMLSHQIGAGQRADLKRLSETREELERLQRDFDKLHKRSAQQANERERHVSRLTHVLRERETQCEHLKQRERDLTRQLTESESAKRDQALSQVNSELTQARLLLETRAQEAASWHHKWEEAQETIARLSGECREKDAECGALERLMVQGLGADSCEDYPEEACACRADLAGRLVLCVGGRKPLVEQYRHLVARCNGRFDHHDGGLEDNQRRLESMLASADAVVCAADYVSHTAYYRTKRFCKRFAKPHVLLSNSGISSFALALERVAC